MSAPTSQRPAIGNPTYHSSGMAEATQAVETITHNLADFRQELAAHSLMLQRLTQESEAALGSARASSVQPTPRFSPHVTTLVQPGRGRFVQQSSPIVAKLDQLSRVVQQCYGEADRVRGGAQSRLMDKYFQINSAMNHTHADPNSLPTPQ